MMPVGHHNQLPVFVQTHVAQGFLAVHFLLLRYLIDFVVHQLCGATAQ